MDSNRPKTSTKLPLSSESFLYFLSFVEESSLMKEAAWLFKYWRAFLGHFLFFLLETLCSFSRPSRKDGASEWVCSRMFGEVIQTIEWFWKDESLLAELKIFTKCAGPARQGQVVLMCCCFHVFYNCGETQMKRWLRRRVLNPHRYKINPETINM